LGQTEVFHCKRKIFPIRIQENSLKIRKSNRKLH